MIKHTIEISREPAHLALRHKQIVLQRNGETVAQIPCEDIGVIVVDHPQTTYTHQALSYLASSDAVVVICGPDHLPSSMILPLADHTEVVWRLSAQISMTQPLKKRLWQQIIRAKLERQAENLPIEYPAYRRLKQMAREVRSGDPQNLEASGAKLYWQNWLWQEEFCRDRDEVGINALLNYGYSIVRAAIARAIVSAGLHPSLGVFHRNRSNVFCLADDLVEPFRPWVDNRVRDLFIEGHTEINTHSKQELLEMLTAPMDLDGQQGPAMTMFHRYIASLVHCMEGTCNHLTIPKPC